jgi:hypothetical protein
MNTPKPRQIKRTGKHPYIFKETVDYSHQTSWKLREPFMAEWLEISVEGLVTVKANATGYAWDGCTPKYSFLDIAIAGIPDGHVDIRTGKPFTYRASMVHDALYQYLHIVPIPKSEIDLLFLKILGDFRLRHVYYLFTKYFGGWGVVQTGIQDMITRP